MGKQITYDEIARRKAVEGVQKLAKAVKVTLGPAGKNVIIEKSFGGPQVTKDGVTVAKEIELEDPFENMGAKLVREVASKTNDVAGDGTTTATVLAEAILTQGQRYLTSGVDPNALRAGIDAAVETVTAELAKMAKKINAKSRDEIANVGAISANNDKEIGNLLADAMRRADPDDPDALLRTLPGSEFDAPQGRVRIDEENHHTHLYPRIGRVNARGQFDVLEETRERVRPDPYLVSHTLQDWSMRTALRSSVV